MKRSVLSVLALCTLLTATSASALTLSDGTDVGARDTLKASTYLDNSGDAGELAWVKSILGPDVEWEIKYDVTESVWEQTTEEERTYAMELADSPEYFLIKTANGSITHFLFENQASLDWAVLNLDESFGTGYTIENIGKLSHVVEFDNGATPVPEPGTIVLLGAGILGLAVFGRKRNRK